MFKIDQVKNLLNCDFCNELLIDPVSISCGSNICKKHLDKLVSGYSKDKNTYTCILCREEHFIPKNGFVVNAQIQEFLNIQLNTLKLPQVYDECKVEIEKSLESIKYIESLHRNPDSYVYAYFEDIKKKVDLRRQVLKSSIDEYSEELLQTVEAAQYECMARINSVNSKKSEEMAEKIAEHKKELSDHIKQFDTLEINDKKFESIKQSVASHNENIRRIISDYKRSVIDNKEISFQIKSAKSVKSIFGSLKTESAQVNFSRQLKSRILNSSNLQSKLNQVCGFTSSQKWKLKYRASRDGFNPKSFHTRSDGIPNSLTVIKTANGNVFGGFSEEGWSSKNVLVTDRNAFIFSLINKEGSSFKAICKNNGENAILCHSSLGPIFGYDNKTHDIFISFNSVENQKNFSSFGCTYFDPDYQAGATRAQNILAGSTDFNTVEIEVFAKI